MNKTCDGCNATMSWKRTLVINTGFVNEGNSHIIAQCVNYVDQEKLMCDECPSVFIQKHQLKTHNDNVHSNETII